MTAETAPELAAPTAIAHRDLPAIDQRELDGALGFVKIARLLAGLPLTAFGLIVFASGVVFNVPYLAAGAAVVTVLLLRAIWTDTRLHTALDILRRGDLEGARSRLEAVIRSRRYSPEHRQRARAHLASIAWQRGDLDTALRWTQEQVDGRSHRTREDRGQRWLTDATRVQLLALTGQREAAREALAALPTPPQAEFHRLVHITTRLLVAFGSAVAEEDAAMLDTWAEFARERDGVGTTLALLAWAHADRGQDDAASSLLTVVEAQADLAHIAGHYPMLADWLASRRGTLRYAR